MCHTVSYQRILKCLNSRFEGGNKRVSTYFFGGHGNEDSEEGQRSPLASLLEVRVPGTRCRVVRVEIGEGKLHPAYEFRHSPVNEEGLEPKCIATVQVYCH